MCPGTGSGDPKAIPATPSFLLTVLKVMEVKQVKGREKEAFRLKRERLWVFGFCLKKIPRLWHGHLENGSRPIYPC